MAYFIDFDGTVIWAKFDYEKQKWLPRSEFLSSEAIFEKIGTARNVPYVSRENGRYGGYSVEDDYSGE